VNFDTEVHHAVFCAIVDREVGGESVDGLRMVIVHPHLLTAYDLAFLYKTIYFTSEGGVTQEVPTPESEIRVFHAANGPKILAAADELKSLGPDTVSGFSAAIDIVVRDAINNIKEST
jgi:hypothetical protein